MPCVTLNNLGSKLDETHYAKFVDDRSNDSEKRHIHWVYEKYVILAVQIQVATKNILKIVNSEFLV
jgi:hypothetical protein